MGFLIFLEAQHRPRSARTFRRLFLAVSKHVLENKAVDTLRSLCAQYIYFPYVTTRDGSNGVEIDRSKRQEYVTC